MKVAFDATVLQPPMSGVGYYCEELLKALVENGRSPDLFVFSHRPLNLDFPSNNESVRTEPSRLCPIRAVYMHALLPGLLAREKPDLCHYTNFIAPIRTDLPYVVTVHDMGLESLRSVHPLAKRLYTRRLVPHVARRARLIITNSEYSKREIIRHLGISPDQIRVTPLAASSEFHPVSENNRRRTLAGYDLSEPYLLYVGNLEPRKNLVRLLEAFAGLKDRHHQLVIAGNRWYRGNEVAGAVGRLGLQNRVKLLGYVPRADLPALYSGSTAFVYPSLLEGFGMPIVEAMACGTPVITSDNSALKEIGNGAALLVDAMDVKSIRNAMADIIDDPRLRTNLALGGLRRAAEFSWKKTAELTINAYREAVSPSSRPAVVKPERDPEVIAEAIRKTVDYAAMFQYPLRLEELHDRLFDVAVDRKTLDRICNRLGLARHSGMIVPDAEFVAIRTFREALSDRSIEGVWPHLKTLANFPFVKMIAFSGATAHRNMTDPEDIDLFIVVEDGKMWATYLMAMVWAKAKGLRRRLCMNYLITDRALPLVENDAFTAQQVASLKPVFGKSTYDDFLKANSFVCKRFPNFDARRHRDAYPEIAATGMKRGIELLLRFGPVQICEKVGHWILNPYLSRKSQRAAARAQVDVLLEPRRLKLHMNSHKQAVLEQAGQASELVPR